MTTLIRMTEKELTKKGYFATDRALIVATFETVNISIDWPRVREALARIGRDKDTFIETRSDIWARGTLRYIQTHVKQRASGDKKDVEAFKAQVARYKTFTLEDATRVTQATNASAKKANTHGQRSELEEAAFKSGRNAWDYIVKTAGYVTQETRGGNRTPHVTKANEEKPASPTVVSPVPVTLPNIVLPKATGPNDLLSFNLSLRAFMIRVQAANAQAYTGARGAALLAAHNAYVKAIAEAEAIKD